jgi:hypothetical protein
MEMKQHNPSNTNNHCNVEEYKICAGRQCNNPGKNLLEILFINKPGWFCDSCRDDLVKLELAKRDDLT